MKNIKMTLSVLKEPEEAMLILNLDDIDFSTESQDDLDFLAKSITSHINLTQISLRRTNLGLAKNKYIKGVFEAIQHHQNLSSITLADASLKIENIELIQTLASCLAGSKIQELVLGYNQIDAKFLSDIISNNKNLKMLSINGINLGSWNETEVALLCKSISSSFLESLSMSQNELGKLISLSMLGVTISNSLTLSTLSVADNNIGENEEAADFLQKISGLKYLYLSHNSLVNIGPESWENFISALIHKRNLIELDISSNSLSLLEEFLKQQNQSFLTYLVELQKSIPSLKLDYSDNNIKEFSLAAAADKNTGDLFYFTIFQSPHIEGSLPKKIVEDEQIKTEVNKLIDQARYMFEARQEVLIQARRQDPELFRKLVEHLQALSITPPTTPPITVKSM